MRFFVRLSRFAVGFAALSLPYSVAIARDIYIAQNAVGANNGFDCADAHAVSFFNAAANWGSGPAQIGPGTTAHLCGVITTELTVQGSGTSGSPITILFQPHAQVTLPACDSTNGCVNVRGKSYIIIDGGTACGPGTACASTSLACVANALACGTGSIVQTSNGTLPFSITNITCNGGVATVTGPSPFGFSLSPYPAVLPVYISDNSVSSYNGSWTVASNDDTTNTFTFNVPCNGTGTGGSAGALCLNGSYCTHDSAAIMLNGQGTGCANCEFRNLIVGPLYYRTSYRDAGSGGGLSGTTYFEGTTGTLKIHDNVMPYAISGIQYVPISGGDSGLSIYNNEIYNTNGGIVIASSSNISNLSGAQIYGNYIHDAQLEDAAGCPGHHDGIHMWGINGGTNANVNFYNNWISGNFGGCPTGAIFFEGTNRNVQMYNNLINITYTVMYNGIVNVNGDGVAGGYQIYNNTIMGNHVNDTCFVIGGIGNSVSFENNIVSGCGTLIYVLNATTTTSWDYNIYGCQNLMGASCGSSGYVPSSNFVSSPSSITTWYNFSGWKSLCSCDAHSVQNYGASWLALGSNGTPQYSSPAISAGTNLTSLGITPLNSDRLGTPRPSIGAWTIGAYNYASPSTTIVPPSALTSLAK